VKKVIEGWLDVSDMLPFAGRMYHSEQEWYCGNPHSFTADNIYEFLSGFNNGKKVRITIKEVDCENMFVPDEIVFCLIDGSGIQKVKARLIQQVEDQNWIVRNCDNKVYGISNINTFEKIEEIPK